MGAGSTSPSAKTGIADEDGDLAVTKLLATGCWLLVLGCIMQAQQPTFKNHKVTNVRLAPPNRVLVPFVQRTHDGVVIFAYRLYKIEMVKALAWEMLGWTEDSQRTIRILSGQSLEEEQIAVQHELMHASIGTDRSDEKQSLHEAIYLFSSMEPELLKRNPELEAYLTQ